MARKGSDVGASTTGVRLEQVTEDNLKAVCALRVGPGQGHLVADNLWSLAEAYVHHEHAWPRAIVRDGTIVGFLMLLIDPEHDDGRPFWLWRLMVAADQQGQGIGSAAVALACDEVRSRGATEIYTSWVPGDGSPAPFYLGLGFEPTGEIDDGEVVARLAFGSAATSG